MARAKKKFSQSRKKRGGKKYARRRKSSRGFKRVECQLGRAALAYSRAKGYLSRVEKGVRGKAANPSAMVDVVRGGSAGANQAAMVMSSATSPTGYVAIIGGKNRRMRIPFSYQSSDRRAWAIPARKSNNPQREMSKGAESAWVRLQNISNLHNAQMYAAGPHKYGGKWSFRTKSRVGLSVPDVIDENVKILGRGNEEEIKARNLWYLTYYPDIWKAASARGRSNNPRESNADLLARYRLLKGMVEKQTKQMERMALGSSARERKARAIGSLNFTLFGIEHELAERGLKSNNPRQHFKEITSADVGKSLFKAFGKAWPTSSFIGRIMKQDIGKRVYLVGDILQVENNEQRDQRVRGGSGDTYDFGLSPTERSQLLDRYTGRGQPSASMWERFFKKGLAIYGYIQDGQPKGWGLTQKGMALAKRLKEQNQRSRR